VKINVAFKLLLIFSIVLQSFIAVSASFDTHQLDVAHLQTEHDHATDIGSKLSADKNIDEHNVNDCHHCGHCSGSHISWVSGKTVNAELSLFSLHSFQLSHAVPYRTLSSIYRPPIT